MARHEDTIGLFGVDGGVSTYGNITCGWCKTEYTDRESDDDPDVVSNEPLGWVQFGDLQVVECCYEKVEEAVLSRMGYLVPWFMRILERNRQGLERQENMIASLRETLNSS